MEQLIRGQDALAASKPYSVQRKLNGRLCPNPIGVLIFTFPTSIHDGGLLTIAPSVYFLTYLLVAVKL
jgi:hypothetical protein